MSLATSAKLSLSRNKLSIKRLKQALEAKNLCLKSDLVKHKNEIKNSDLIIFKLEEKNANAKIESNKHAEECKKLEIQKGKLGNILVDKEKEIFKLKAVAESLSNDNAKTSDNLLNITRTLKISEKEASKARNRCENLESTVVNLKAEKSSLQKSMKKMEKSRKKEQIDQQKYKIREVENLKALEATNFKDHEEKEHQEAPIAYNLPVSPNPFKVLDDEKDLTENNNISKDTCETFEAGIKKEGKIKPLENKKNIDWSLI